ncbi:hypothetical protein ACP8HI_19270 [Paenibacillus sp. FA6]|uniref:hypothetical protein n=1 Tax=Paenibacillus sp. FA6 TaxID=3413029 RepID=UPI003F65DD0C
MLTAYDYPSAKLAEEVTKALSIPVIGAGLDVENKRFPEEKHSFTMKEEELKGLYGDKQ